MPRLPQMASAQNVPASPMKFENRPINGETLSNFPEISSTTNNGHVLPQVQQQVLTPTSTTFGGQEMFPLDALNPAHTGSPGFLRGRGRGRPKLIGDELDAELVEYMVQVGGLRCFNGTLIGFRSNNRTREDIWRHLRHLLSRGTTLWRKRRGYWKSMAVKLN